MSKKIALIIILIVTPVCLADVPEWLSVRFMVVQAVNVQPDQTCSFGFQPFIAGRFYNKTYYLKYQWISDRMTMGWMYRGYGAFSSALGINAPLAETCCLSIGSPNYDCSNLLPERRIYRAQNLRIVIVGDSSSGFEIIATNDNISNCGYASYFKSWFDLPDWYNQNVCNRNMVSGPYGPPTPDMMCQFSLGSDWMAGAGGCCEIMSCDIPYKTGTDFIDYAEWSSSYQLYPDGIWELALFCEDWLKEPE